MYKGKPENKTWCKCHPTQFYDAAKYKGCYRCYVNGYACCDARAINEQFGKQRKKNK